MEQLPTYYAPSDEPVTDAYQRAFTADILSYVSIRGYEDFNTSQSEIAMGLGVLERELRDCIRQPDRSLQSYSIVDVWEHPGNQETRLGWERGVSADRDFFFARPEPPENSDVSALSEQEAEIVLAKRDKLRHMKDCIRVATANRVLCITESGYLGLVPSTSESGDAVAVLFGGYTPFVLRESKDPALGTLDNGRRWQVVGECYIHGFMDGEALDGLDQDGTEVRSEEFVLI